MLAAGSGNESCRYTYSFHVRALRPFRASPGRRRLPSDHSKVFAQMCLIHKSTSKRNVAQRPIGLKHVLGSQFDAAPDHKCVGGVPECAPKGARKVRFAAPHQSAQICDQHATGDMAVDVFEHLACLPCEQTLFSVVPRQRLWIDLPSQQRGCFEQGVVRRFLAVKPIDGRIHQGYYMVQPVNRSRRTGLRLADLSLHEKTVSAPMRHVNRELQWIKAPSIEGLKVRRH
jgi:hypothetical protein